MGTRTPDLRFSDILDNDLKESLKDMIREHFKRKIVNATIYNSVTDAPYPQALYYVNEDIGSTEEIPGVPLQEDPPTGRGTAPRRPTFPLGASIFVDDKWDLVSNNSYLSQTTIEGNCEKAAENFARIVLEIAKDCLFNAAAGASAVSMIAKFMTNNNLLDVATRAVENIPGRRANQYGGIPAQNQDFAHFVPPIADDAAARAHGQQTYQEQQVTPAARQAAVWQPVMTAPSPAHARPIGDWMTEHSQSDYSQNYAVEDSDATVTNPHGYDLYAAQTPEEEERGEAPTVIGRGVAPLFLENEAQLLNFGMMAMKSLRTRLHLMYGWPARYRHLGPFERLFNYPTTEGTPQTGWGSRLYTLRECLELPITDPNTLYPIYQVNGFRGWRAEGAPAADVLGTRSDWFVMDGTCPRPNMLAFEGQPIDVQPVPVHHRAIPAGFGHQIPYAYKIDAYATNFLRYPSLAITDFVEGAGGIPAPHCWKDRMMPFFSDMHIAYGGQDWTVQPPADSSTPLVAGNGVLDEILEWNRVNRTNPPFQMQDRPNLRQDAPNPHPVVRLNTQYWGIKSTNVPPTPFWNGRIFDTTRSQARRRIGPEVQYDFHAMKLIFGQFLPLDTYFIQELCLTIYTRMLTKAVQTTTWSIVQNMWLNNDRVTALIDHLRALANGNAGGGAPAREVFGSLIQLTTQRYPGVDPRILYSRIIHNFVPDSTVFTPLFNAGQMLNPIIARMREIRDSFTRLVRAGVVWVTREGGLYFRNLRWNQERIDEEQARINQIIDLTVQRAEQERLDNTLTSNEWLAQNVIETLANYWWAALSGYDRASDQSFEDGRPFQNPGPRNQDEVRRRRLLVDRGLMARRALARANECIPSTDQATMGFWVNPETKELCGTLRSYVLGVCYNHQSETACTNDGCSWLDGKCSGIAPYPCEKHDGDHAACISNSRRPGTSQYMCCYDGESKMCTPTEDAKKNWMQWDSRYTQDQTLPEYGENGMCRSVTPGSDETNVNRCVEELQNKNCVAGDVFGCAECYAENRVELENNYGCSSNIATPYCAGLDLNLTCESSLVSCPLGQTRISDLNQRLDYGRSGFGYGCCVESCQDYQCPAGSVLRVNAMDIPIEGKDNGDSTCCTSTCEDLEFEACVNKEGCRFINDTRECKSECPVTAEDLGGGGVQFHDDEIQGYFPAAGNDCNNMDADFAWDEDDRANCNRAIEKHSGTMYHCRYEGGGYDSCERGDEVAGDLDLVYMYKGSDPLPPGYRYACNSSESDISFTLPKGVSSENSVDKCSDITGDDIDTRCNFVWEGSTGERCHKTNNTFLADECVKVSDLDDLEANDANKYYMCTYEPRSC